MRDLAKRPFALRLIPADSDLQSPACVSLIGQGIHDLDWEEQYCFLTPPEAGSSQFCASEGKVAKYLQRTGCLRNLNEAKFPCISILQLLSSTTCMPVSG